VTRNRRRRPGDRRPTRIAALVALVGVLLVAASGCSLFDKSVDVLYVGDSIMVQTGPFAELALVTEPGVDSAKTRVEAVSGTGLLTPGLKDWTSEIEGLIDTYKPKVVVVLFIGNYTDTDFWLDPAGQPIPNDYGPAFFEAWGREAESFSAKAAAKGARVDWVLPPPLAGEEGERRSAAMRTAYEDLQSRVPSIGLIDGRVAIGGPDGEWTWRREGVNGGEVTVRQPDSVHLTDDGGRLMAREIARTVGPQLVQIRAQSA
jgi:hypothetical protein